MAVTPTLFVSEKKRKESVSGLPSKERSQAFGSRFPVEKTGRASTHASIPNRGLFKVSVFKIYNKD